MASADTLRLGKPMQGPDVSIIIVTWNSSKFIKSCLESVYKHPVKAPFEVLVVDNASKDDTLSIIRRYFPQVLLISNRANRGFAAANNQAIRLSKGTYILLLNPDTLVLPGAIDQMVQFLEEHREVALAGPRLLSPENKIVESYSLFPGPRVIARWLYPILFCVSFQKFESQPSAEPRQVDWVVGACMLIRRQALEQVGLLDESFFMYWEDADLCWRLREHHWETFYLPGAAVIHYQGGSSSQAEDKLVLHGTLPDVWVSSTETFLYKHYSPWVRRVFKALTLTLSLSAIVFWSMVYAFRSSKRTRALTIIRIYRRTLTISRHQQSSTS